MVTEQLKIYPIVTFMFSQSFDYVEMVQGEDNCASNTYSGLMHCVIVFMNLLRIKLISLKKSTPWHRM
jgi:hypothetical protein